jgi:2-polyprenyl-3-methyl-5-hydroxy-6-metoxy-1,4-benzoquinol methylase
MPIVPNAWERFLLGRLNMLPGLLLDYGGALGFRAAIVASRLGIFDVLARGPLTTADVAAGTSTDERAVGQLLDALGALGYIRESNGRWSLTPLARRWLTSDSPDSIVAGLAFLEFNAFEIWRELEDAVRSGRPRRNLYDVLEASPELSSSFQAWDRVAGRLVGEPLASVLPIPRDARRLLDLGGGNGIFSLLLCRRYPQLSATIVDLPRALQSAEEAIAEAALSDRVTTRAGDFFEVDLGTGFDVVLIANIVHGLSVSDAERLVRRAAEAARPGGLVIVVDQEPAKGGGATAAITALLGIGYVVALGGQIWPPETIDGWLRSAGLESIRDIRARRAPGNIVVIGTRGGTGRP